MDKLDALMALCCNVSIDSGEHRISYESTEKAVEDWFESDEEPIDEDLLNRAKSCDNLVRLWVYPRTPVGFYMAAGTSCEEVVNSVLESVVADMDYIIASCQKPAWWKDRAYVVAAYGTIGGMRHTELTKLFDGK